MRTKVVPRHQNRATSLELNSPFRREERTVVSGLDGLYHSRDNNVGLPRSVSCSGWNWNASFQNFCVNVCLLSSQDKAFSNIISFLSYIFFYTHFTLLYFTLPYFSLLFFTFLYLSLLFFTSNFSFFLNTNLDDFYSRGRFISFKSNRSFYPSYMPGKWKCLMWYYTPNKIFKTQFHWIYMWLIETYSLVTRTREENFAIFENI